jgi:hypothetical protein
MLAWPASAVGSGGFAAPAPGASLTGGSVAETRWRLEAEEIGDADEAELVLSLDGGRTFPVRVSSELSPRAASYRWRVPSLPTHDARLALRVGFDRAGERERIVVISGEFAIAAEAPEVGTLAHGASEWWTEQALSERGLSDVLGGSVAPDGERLVAARHDTDADCPTAAAKLPPPGSNAFIDDSRAASRTLRPALSILAPPLSTPLRL